MRRSEVCGVLAQDAQVQDDAQVRADVVLGSSHCHTHFPPVVKPKLIRVIAPSATRSAH